MLLLSSAELFTVSCFCCLLLNYNLIFLFSKKSFMNTIRVSSGLNPDEEQPFVGSELGPNCLQSF